jgi:GNAT superfamily N-acetyltransferase
MLSNGDATDAVRPLCEADVESCAHALASAFASDPVYRYIHPGDREWERVGPRFFRILLRYFASHATVLTPASGRAAAIWTPPEPRPPGGIARLRFTMRISALLGRRISRGARVGTALESLHRDEPQWYLAILGTHPAVQRRGLASRLLEPVLARCDAGNVPAHLETATETNLDFYASRGFGVIAEARVVGGPRIWRLRRAPRRISELPAREG